MFSGICCGFDSMKIDNRNSFLFVSDPITNFFFFSITICLFHFIHSYLKKQMYVLQDNIDQSGFIR